MPREMYPAVRPFALLVLAAALTACSESVAPEDPPKVTFILSDSTVMHSTFTFLTSAPVDDCFRVSYRLDKGRMTGPLTNRMSGGLNEGGPAGHAGSMSWALASDGEPTERCNEFGAVLTVGSLVFELEGLVERSLRPGTATSGPVGASGAWSRDGRATGPFVFYDYDREQS